MSAILSLAILGATAIEQTFDGGVRAYREQRYEASAAAFQQLVDEGVADPAVFFNLGNAYYRSGMLGRAIANYERAIYLDPSMDGARENLVLAVAETRRRLPNPARDGWEKNVFLWYDAMRSETMLVVAITLWVAMWTLLGVRLLRPLPVVRPIVAVTGVLALAFAYSTWAKMHPRDVAVAVVEQAPVRYGTSETETVRFELFEGDRVIVDARNNGWARIVTSDGNRGWTEIDHLEFVHPPYHHLRSEPTEAEI